MTEPRPLLGGRYSLERPLLSAPNGHRWMAIEASSGRLVVVALAEPGRLSTFGKGVTHRHLVTVTEVLKEVDPSSFPADVTLPLGAGCAVADHRPGQSLRQALESGADWIWLSVWQDNPPALRSRRRGRRLHAAQCGARPGRPATATAVQRRPTAVPQAPKTLASSSGTGRSSWS